MTSAKYAVDSRLVQKGSVFFALKGVKTDGHFYLKEAFVKGAKRAYVSKSYTGDSFGLELIYVEDPLFCKKWHKQKSDPINLSL